MNLNLVSQKPTPLLSRKRVNFEVTFSDKTPSREEIKKSVSDALKVDSSLVTIRHIYQKFGLKKAKVIANIYDNPESLKKIEELKKKKIIQEKRKKELEEHKKKTDKQEKQPAVKNDQEEKTQEQSTE